MPNRQREITLRFVAEPTDINFLGKVHGGAVMKWIDIAGGTCAAAWCGNSVVTIYVGGIRFYKPIQIGHLVEVHARLIYTGRRSMHITVDVQAGDPRDGIFTETTHCVIVFVALDSEGNMVEVPKWSPQTDEDRALGDYAVQMMERGKEIQEEIDRFTEIGHHP
jgi:acyl-CoA hydrolase